MDNDTLIVTRSHNDAKEAEPDTKIPTPQCEALFEQARTLFDFHRLYLVVTYGSNHAVVRRDNEAVEANFRDVNIDLLSPAFLFPHAVQEGFRKGTASPTCEVDFDIFLRSVTKRNEWASLNLADFQSEGGRSFPTLYISNAPPSTGHDSLRSTKLRIWIQAAVHGSEPAGDQALLALIGKMEADPTWTASVLDKVDIFILPRYNPDGVANFQRTLLSNLDPNRDHIKLACQNTRDIKKLFSAFAPHIAIDMHEYSAATRYRDEYRQASDGLYSAAKNLNIHPDIRRISEDLFATRVARDLKLAGFRGEPYATGTMDGTNIVFAEAGSDAKLGRNAMGLTQCISFLTESRGIGLADQEFQRRTAASLTMVKSIIQTATDNAEELYNTVERSIDDFTNSNDDIVVIDSPNVQYRTFTMVNTNTGNIEQVPVRFLSTTPTTRKLTRARPAAYIIPKSWPALASQLIDSGVVVDTISQTYQGIVEAYKFTAVTFEDTYYEGVVPVVVQTEIVTQKIELEAGAYWISTRQKNAALAFMAIEPDNIDSWVSSNIIPVTVGNQLPVFRVMDT